MTAQELNGWLYHGGGLALWTELYAGFGLVPAPGRKHRVQMGGVGSTRRSRVLRIFPDSKCGFRASAARYTNLISIFRFFTQPISSKFAVSNERSSRWYLCGF